MSKLRKIKSTLVSGALALSTIVAPFTTGSLSANAADGDNYAKLLQYSLYFYDANMCGADVPSNSRLTWRGACHTSDEVNGGFHDAGDHAMFGQPQGYAASTLAWGYYEFSDAYEATGQTAHYKTIADYFCKFFRDSTEMQGGKVSRVLIEKGEGGIDHSYWGPPESQGARGRMLWTSDGAANITAEYAAALAANYVNFGNPEDLKYAEALFDFAKGHSGSYSCEFYSNDKTSDEIGWAACWLYLATKDDKYLGDVNNVGEAWYVHCWENVSLGAAILKGEITNDWSATNELGNFNGDGYKFIDTWGSARHNATAQLCSLVAAKYGKADSSWAKGQMEYITGDKAFANGNKYCLVVGFKDNASSMPHHRAASGTDSAETDGVPSKYVLVGALCGGPTDANGTYADKRSDYKANEVAIDYNAGFVGAAAGLYHFYKTGTAVSESSIPGVKAGSSEIVNTTQPTTNTTTTTTPNNDWNNTTTSTVSNNNNNNNTPNNNSTGDVVLSASDMVIGNDNGNVYAQFNPQGAKSATLYIKVKSGDNNVSGGFGTSINGEWKQTDFSANVSGGSASVDYTLPSNASEVKAMIWWPNGDNAEIEKIVLHGSSSTENVQQTTQTTTTTTTTSTTTSSTTSQNWNNNTTTAPNVTSVTQYGDANCDGQVNLSDAVMIMQAISNPSKYGVNGSEAQRITAQGWANADCKNVGDGVTNTDALAIQQMLLKLCNLPC